MAAIAPVALLDGQATPVSHNFQPSSIKAGVSLFSDRSGGIAIGYPIISHFLREPVKGNRNYKLTLKVTLPVLEVTSPATSTGIQPAPTKSYDLLASMEFVIPERSTLAQRKDILAFAKNLLANSMVTTSVESFESLY